MDGALEALRKEFGGLRTGRASASLLEPITVEAYGQQMPLNQVGTISVPEARLIFTYPFLFDNEVRLEPETAARVREVRVDHKVLVTFDADKDVHWIRAIEEVGAIRRV